MLSFSLRKSAMVLLSRSITPLTSLTSLTSLTPTINSLRASYAKVPTPTPTHNNKQAPLGTNLPGDTTITVALLQDHFKASGYTFTAELLENIRVELDKQFLNTLGNMRRGIGSDEVWKATTLPPIARKALQDTFCQQVYKYRKPHQLQQALGSSWPYQPLSMEDEEVIRSSLEQHYTSWKAGSWDKTRHPLFLALWGPGRGKSRLLDEFQGICQKVTSSNPELQARFSKNCYVFKLTFENGTSFISDKPTEQLARRVLHQLDPKRDIRSLDSTPPTKELISSMLAAEGVHEKDATIFLLVDSVQKLYHADCSLLNHTISELSDLVNASDPFVVACATGTFFEPIAEVMKASNQLRVYISTPVIDGHKLIKTDDPVVKQLIDDMGGYGRPLEGLQDKLDKIPDLNNFNIDNLLNAIVDMLASKYPDVKNAAGKLVPAVLHVLMQKPLLTHDSKLDTGNLTVDDVVQMGLFEYDSSTGLLHCPFILLCLLSQWSSDPILAHLDLPSYNRKNKYTDVPNSGRFWQDWEEFLAQFRVLKSKLYASKEVPFRQLHAGAAIGKDGDVLVQQELATGYFRSQHIIQNADAAAFCREHPNKVVLNANSAPASDLFYGLTTREGHIVEHIQAKAQKVTTSIAEWENEASKARGTRNDFFMLFTTNRSKITESDLPPRGGIVSKENFTTYFGPFSARAFRAEEIKRKFDINECTYEELMQRRGLGKVKVQRIMEARNSGPFADRKDFLKRTGVNSSYAELFIFPGVS